MITLAKTPVLVTPTMDGLGGYEDALKRGWSPDPRRVGDAAYIKAELAALRKDRVGALDRILNHPAPAHNASPTMPVNHTLWHALWISDGEFAGKADLRYVPETGAVPQGVPGHIGYSVVPWKQGRGYATAALRALIDFARSKGLTELQILCNVENLASRTVIERVGGEVDFVGPHPSDWLEQVKLYYRVRV
ncbi:GNAT family N-acetyltransferase [Pleomorphomonas oryzae]|uniref:GNAT family N-acetyltransferase n=1 Tax=Pleomorphomonas oryzae TaxID=261934 RepID=UPI0003FAAC93|nr:GNAT family N-acetyltransferase [Pleomorphomonas oryzae]